MRRYKHVNITPDGIDHCEIGLSDDGSFVWMMTRSGDGGTASHDARGRWNQTGDTLTFETEIRSDVSAPVPTTGTVSGDRLELAGFGTFG